MAKCRLMNTNEDYQRLNLQNGKVELWEDGKRDDDRKDVVEWWYFDAILDDGSKIAACYSTKVQPFMNKEGTHPCLKFDITTPDGKQTTRRITKFSSVSIAKDKCDVRWDKNCFTGDLHTYYVKAVPEKGFGYHDHQWGNTLQFDFLNHWLWSRQSTEKHSLVVFDFIMNEHYGYKRIPLVFMQDNDGKLLFQSSDNVECTVTEEFLQDASHLNFPKVTKYTFRDGNKTLHYTLSVKQELDGRYIYKQMPFFMRGLFKGTKPKYGRYLAHGSFDLEENGTVLHDESDLIYEFAYVGENYKTHMETV